MHFILRDILHIFIFFFVLIGGHFMWIIAYMLETVGVSEIWAVKSKYFGCQYLCVS